jgi:hypothetical protein
MGILEWIGAHLLGPFVNLYRVLHARPRPDVRILDLEASGGSSGSGGSTGSVDFTLQVANYGTQQCRCQITARIADEVLLCHPAALDLIPNTPPTAVRVFVPRPRLGDLVPEFHNETTLYDQTLRVEAAAGKHTASKDWHEILYTPETNRDRYDLQQRAWRRGRGRETAEDLRADAINERFRKIDEESS